MRKYNITLCILMSTMLLSACEPKNSVDVSSSNDTSDELSNFESTSESSLTMSASEEDTWVKDDSIIDITKLEIGVNDSYNIPAICKDEFQDSYFEIYINDKDMVKADAFDNVHGLKEGTTTIKVVVDEMYYDELEIEVKSEDYMNQNFKFDKARLQGKSFIVFGDSISDVTVTAYPSNRPKFWCEQLVEKYDMTMYNEAISGSTTGYCKGLMDKGDFTHILGTFVVNQSSVKEEIKKSDYAFIYFGNNDVTYGSHLGSIGDVNDDNYQVTESFRGSYAYLIDKIRESNPHIKIVCLSLSSSSWGIEVCNPSATYAKSRKEMSNVVQELAETKKTKFIDIYGLWTSQDEYGTCCPDGIHPQTAGYNLIVEKILNS